MRYKVAIRFAIEGDVRFISHHDTMRLFERALSRTGLPVRFSEGFNPRPKLSLPLPRPVGIATQADVLVVEFTSQVACEQVLRELSAQMPGGVELKDAWLRQTSRPMQPESASYTLDLSIAEIPALIEQIRTVLAADAWLVQRSAGESGPARSLDLRKQLVEAKVEGTQLQWTIRIDGGGSVRPGEVLATLGIDPGQRQHQIRRTGIAWQPEKVHAEAGKPSDPGH